MDTTFPHLSPGASRSFKKQLLALFAPLAITVAALYSPCVVAQSNDLDAIKTSYSEESKGRYGQAASVLEPLLRRTPDSAFLLARLGWLSYLQGKHNDAIGKYSQALAVRPQAHDIRLGLSLPLMAQQRWQEAADEVNKVIDVSPWNYNAHIKLLICEQGLRQWKQMEQHAMSFSQRYPLDPSAWVYLARSLAWQGKKEAAKKAYWQVLEISPTHAEAVSYLNKNP